MGKTMSPLFPFGLLVFSKVCVAEWPPVGKKAAHLVDHKFSLYFDYKLFPVLILRAGLELLLLLFLAIAFLLLILVFLYVMYEVHSKSSRTGWISKNVDVLGS